LTLESTPTHTLNARREAMLEREPKTESTHGRPSRQVWSGRLVPGLLNDRAQHISSPPPSTRFLKKKHCDIFFSQCHTHATVVDASTALPTRRWPSPTRRPSLTTAFMFGRRAPTPPRCYLASIPRRWLPPIALVHSASLPPAHRVRPSRAARSHPAKPSPVLLAMVVVVLVRCRLRRRRLESPDPGLPHVASACFKCFRCFVGMFEVFHADIVKVDRDIAHIVMVVHVCCKCLFSMFQLFFHTYVANMFIWMLHMFHTYVASFLFGCCVCL